MVGPRCASGLMSPVFSSVLAGAGNEPKQHAGAQEQPGAPDNPAILQEHAHEGQERPEAEEPELGLEPGIVVGHATPEEHG